MSMTKKQDTLEEIREIIRDLGKFHQKAQQEAHKAQQEAHKAQQEAHKAQQEIHKAWEERQKQMDKARQERQKQMDKARQERQKQIDKAWQERQRQMDKTRQERQRQMDKTRQERQKQMDKAHEQAKKEMEEIRKGQKESQKRIRELNELFTGQWGKLMESLVEGDLIRLLKGRNIDVDRLLRETSCLREGLEYEFDLIAINGHEIVVVEVKTTLRLKDVDTFIEKLGKFKQVWPEYGDRILYGAIAYLKENEGAARNSEKRGLFVIRATGSSASIINKKEFKPKEFGKV